MDESPGKEATLNNSEESVEFSKQIYREEVWDYLETNRLVTFPRPAYGRIPNFKGCEEAAAKLLDLEEFKSAKSVEVNPDKPLEHSRILVIQNDKELYVPIPGLEETLLKKIPPPEDSEKSIKRIVSRWGIEHRGKAINVDGNIHIDLLIVGSVAVSKEGYRIGKGRGYADLEFAILKEMKAIDDNTVIVTTVHDRQVYDTLPKEIFGEHDTPVDYILTPTQIIKVEPKLPRPKGIIWNILSQKRVNLISPLHLLKQKYESEGKEITLKPDSESDIEKSSKDVLRYRYKRNTRRRPRSTSKTSESEAVVGDGQAKKPVVRKHRFFRRSKQNQTEELNANGGDSTENGENTPAKKPYRMRRLKPFSRINIDFSLMVSNIERNVRVRDLKSALTASGIKPNDITWRGYKGFCYLHYAKPNPKKADVPEPFAVDNVIEILQTLKISPASKNNLSVKVMEPITRIETTDVTAV